VIGAAGLINASKSDGWAGLSPRNSTTRAQEWKPETIVPAASFDVSSFTLRPNMSVQAMILIAMGRHIVYQIPIV